MTVEEAIGYLDKVRIDEKFGIDSMVKASAILNTCKEALEKQMERKPFVKLYYDAVCCPICNETIDNLYMGNQRDKYCHNCGQKINRCEGYDILREKPNEAENSI